MGIFIKEKRPAECDSQQKISAEGGFKDKEIDRRGIFNKEYYAEGRFLGKEHGQKRTYWEKRPNKWDSWQMIPVEVDLRVKKPTEGESSSRNTMPKVDP